MERPYVHPPCIYRDCGAVFDFFHPWDAGWPGASQKLVANAPVASSAKNEAKTASKDEKPDLTFYDSVKKEESAALKPAPVKPDLVPDADAAETPKEKKSGGLKPAAETHAPEPAPSNPSPSKVINYQIGALRKAADAQKLVSRSEKEGLQGVHPRAPGRRSESVF